MPAAALITGCINAGGGGSYPAGWDPFPGIAGEYTCDSVTGSGGSTEDFCATGEHPHLCDC